jgi:thiamine biosynthesis lipoprotein
VEGVDLGGIAKGYALDRAAEKLRGRGISAALLDAGGQLLAMGAPPGEEGWSVAVADPADRGRPALPLLLRDASAATSGDSQRPGEIVDPADGSSIAWSGSVTVIHPEATAADALSTALFVLGPRRGLAWASHESDLLALYLERSGSAPDRPVVQSSRLLPPEGSIYFAFSPSIHQGRHLRVEIR